LFHVCQSVCHCHVFVFVCFWCPRSTDNGDISVAPIKCAQHMHMVSADPFEPTKIFTPRQDETKQNKQTTSQSASQPKAQQSHTDQHLEPARASNLVNISTSLCLLFSVQCVSPNRHSPSSSYPKTDGSCPRHTPHQCAAKDPLAAHTPTAIAGQLVPCSACSTPYQPHLMCTHCLCYAYTNLISTT
jgi:hypothetical protein